MKTTKKNNKEEITLFESDALTKKLSNGKTNQLGRGFRNKELDEADLIAKESPSNTEDIVEDNWLTDESSQLLTGWLGRSLLFGILILVIAGLWAFQNLHKEALVIKERERILAAAAAVIKREKQDLANKEANIKECVKGYLEARYQEDRAKWCRNPEVTRFKMNQHYVNGRNLITYSLEENREAQFSLKNAINYSEIELSGKPMVLVDVTCRKTNTPEQSHPSTRVESDNISLLLQKQADTSYRVDWDTAVVFQPSDWTLFVTSKSTDPHTFRLQISDKTKTGPYLHNYRDDSIYQAYKVSIRDEPTKFLLAYTKKDSHVDIKLKELLDIQATDNRRTRSEKSKTIMPVTLKLAFPNNAESKQCVDIVDIVSATWFTP